MKQVISLQARCTSCRTHTAQALTARHRIPSSSPDNGWNWR